MKRRSVGLLVTAAVVMAGAIAVPAEAHSSKRVVGYYTNWSGYDRNFLVSDLVKNGSAARLTQINYAFGFLDAQGNCVSSDPWADYQRPFSAEQSVNGTADEPGQVLNGNLNQLKQLKQKFPKLRISISLGGWTGSAHFSDAALTPASRAAHVKSCLDMWLKGNLPGLPAGAAKGIFDGVDLDWEWPASEGNPGNVIRPEDKQNFTALVHEYRKQLDRLSRPGRYNLTAFLPANPTMIDKGFEVRQLFKDLTFGTTQGYDYHGPWEQLTNQQSAIDGPKGDPTTPEFSSQVTIDSYLSRGAPRSKLVMGVPFYSPRLDRRHGPEPRPVPALDRPRAGDVRSRYGGLPPAQGDAVQLHRLPGQQGRVRLAVRRYDVLDLGRPGRDEAQGAVHLAARSRRRDDLVARRRHRKWGADLGVAP